MNLEQLKAEVAKLPPEDRQELAESLKADQALDELIARMGLGRLKAEIQLGLDDFERGECISGEDAFARLRAKYSKKT